MVNVVVVNAYGRTNRGDSVLLDECLFEIRNKYGDDLNSLSVALFSDKGFSEAHPDVISLERIGNAGSGALARLKKPWSTMVSAVYCFFPFDFILSLLPAAQSKTAKAIISADVVVSAPGGYVHDTNFAYIIALFHIYLGVKSDAQVVLAPQSYGPLRSGFGRKLVKHIFNRADAVCAREGYSLNFLRSLGVNESLIVASGDSAFWNDHVSTGFAPEFLKSIGLKNKEEFVGLTVVDWSFPGNEFPLKAKDKYVQSLRYVIKEVYERRGLRSIIFNQVRDDLSLVPEVIAGFDGVVLVDDKDKEPEYLRELISHSKVFLGTRFHSCIFAVMAGVPTNAIAYLPKTEYILRDLGFSERHVDINDIDQELLLARILTDLDDVESVSLKINSAVESYRSRMARLVDVL